jgi:FRG domain
MPVSSDWSQKLREFVDTWKQNPDSREYLGDGSFPRFALTEQATSWDDFLRWTSELKGSWCFRGQREATWFLNTSLDRAVRRGYSTANSSGYYHLDRETEGRELLFRFQRQAYSYIDHPPPNDDLSSWFALMQHHGVPTRLLDWTESSYVALYFALEEEPQGKEGLSAIWALDMAWLGIRGRQLLRSKPPQRTPTGSEAEADFNILLRQKTEEAEIVPDSESDAEYLNRLLRQTEEPVIVRINPQERNGRMLAQHGVLLCKLFHQATFSVVLMRMMFHQIPDRPVVRKLEVGRNLRIEFLKNLRAMSINRASLFPGLDGFGMSLKLDLEIKVKGGEK